MALSRSIGVRETAGYIPKGRVNVVDAAARFGVTAEFVHNKTGFAVLSRRDADETTCDMAEIAVRSLCDQDSVRAAKFLAVVTQNAGRASIPHLSAELHARLGLPTDVAAFDLGLACSGWVYGVSIARGFMELNGINRGLLVTVDAYSTVIDEADRDTALLFGDAAAATLLTNEVPHWRIGKTVFGTDGSLANTLRLNEAGSLAMNGRAMFTFAATRMPPALEQVVQMNGLRWDEIDRVLLHQGSRFIVESIADRIPAKERVPFTAGQYGNTVSSTIPLMLASGLFDADRKILVAGFGVGLSWAATVLFREQT